MYSCPTAVYALNSLRLQHYAKQFSICLSLTVASPL